MLSLYLQHNEMPSTKETYSTFRCCAAVLSTDRRSEGHGKYCNTVSLTRQIPFV